MIDGVVNSSLFTIVLTKEYFSRAYCVFEYFIAVIAGKPIIAVSETDSRHGGGSIESFHFSEMFKHILKHEIIEINRSYWDAFIAKLYSKIKKVNYITTRNMVRPNSITDYESSILQAEEITWLSEILHKEELLLGNVLFTTVRHGNTAEAFHSNCDGQGATLSVVE